MSVAFTKEDSAETASETLLPDRPVSPHPNLVTEAGLEALEFQLHRAREAYETAQKIDDSALTEWLSKSLTCTSLNQPVCMMRAIPI